MPAFLDFQVTEGIPLGVFEAHHQEEELLQGLWSRICGCKFCFNCYYLQDLITFFFPFVLVGLGVVGGWGNGKGRIVDF